MSLAPCLYSIYYIHITSQVDGEGEQYSNRNHDSRTGQAAAFVWKAILCLFVCGRLPSAVYTQSWRRQSSLGFFYFYAAENDRWHPEMSRSRLSPARRTELGWGGVREESDRNEKGSTSLVSLSVKRSINYLYWMDFSLVGRWPPCAVMIFVLQRRCFKLWLQWFNFL